MFVIVIFVIVCLSSSVSAIFLPGSPLRVRGGSIATSGEFKKEITTKKMLTKLIGRNDLTSEETEIIWTDMLKGGYTFIMQNIHPCL